MSSERLKAKLFFGIWLIVVIAVIWWISTLCAKGMPPHPHPHKADRKSAFISQGDGALALIARSPIPPMPKSIYPPYYFVATATDENGLESDYSNETTFTNHIPGFVKSIVLGWDASPSTNRIVDYKVYWGRSSGSYTNVQSASTNLWLSVNLLGPYLSNVVVSVTSSNASSLLRSDSLIGPWTNLHRTSWTATNPQAPLYFRGIGEEENEVFISERRF